MFTRKFWEDAAERAVKSAIQAGLLSVGFEAGTDISSGFDVTAVDWAQAGSFALGGAILSVATSIVSRGRGDRESAALRRGVRDDLSDGSLDFEFDERDARSQR